MDLFCPIAAGWWRKRLFQPVNSSSVSKEEIGMPMGIVAGPRTQIKPEAHRPCYHHVAELGDNIDSTFLYFLAVLALFWSVPEGTAEILQVERSIIQGGLI